MRILHQMLGPVIPQSANQVSCQAAASNGVKFNVTSIVGQYSTVQYTVEYSTVSFVI